MVRMNRIFLFLHILTIIKIWIHSRNWSKP